MLSFAQTVFKIIVSAAAFLQVLYLLPAQGARADEIAIIDATHLNVRSEPGTTQPPIAVLQKGTRVSILGRTGGWLKIRHGRRIGYIIDDAKYVYIVTTGEDAGKAPDGSHLDRLIEDARDIDRKIDEGRREIKDFCDKEADLTTMLDEIDLATERIRRRVSATRKELTLTGKQIKKLTADRDRLQSEIQTGTVTASGRLLALYKLSWLGSIPFLASAESIYDFLQREANLQRLLAYDERLIRGLLDKKNRHEKMLERLGTLQDEKTRLETDLGRQLDLLAGKRRRHLHLLAAVKNKKSMEIAFIESLKRAALELNLKLEALGRETAVPAEKTEKKREVSFPSLKGLLHMPVSGKIVTRFGVYRSMKFNVVNFRSGVDIQAERGDPIRAIYGGQVLYADWFKGYGNMMIIDHSDGYYTVYAHMEESFKKKGDAVETGEVIATVGDTGSLIGPALYFEVRHHGTPLDPLEWIKKG